ncbi:hypothetical protein [Archaeoglobus sp.]
MEVSPKNTSKTCSNCGFVCTNALKIRDYPVVLIVEL